MRRFGILSESAPVTKEARKAYKEFFKVELCGDHLVAIKDLFLSLGKTSTAVASSAN